MVTIRKATEKDCIKLANLYIEFEKEKRDEKIDKKWAVDILGYVKFEWDHFYVAEHGHKLVGMLSFVPLDLIEYRDKKRRPVKIEGGCLYDGFVEDRFRGKGIMSLLFNKAEDRAREIGLKFLYTATDKEKAEKLLIKRDYEKIGKERIQNKLTGSFEYYNLFRKKL